MKRGFNKPRRPSANKHYRTVFYIVPEGQETEKSYFSILKELYNLECVIRYPLPRHSSIEEILKKARDISLSQPQDQLWIVLDRDEETHFPHQFDELRNWEKVDSRHHVALSNPRFEYWLLLHFEDNPSSSNARSDLYMVKYLPGYDRSKRLKNNSFKKENVQKAVAASYQKAPSLSSLEVVGSSVGALVKALLNSQTPSLP